MSVCSPRVLLSVTRRQLASYLANPVGYLFVLVFVVATMGYLLFVREDAFFIRNVADLDLLHAFMPWALVVLLPVLGMGAWATEKEQGTEELLLTMPVAILDAVLGKFLAILGFFTIALAICAISAISVLSWLGSPDIGLMLGNFFGWWLLGAIFGSFALVASMLVSSQAVAFVLGVLFTALLMIFLRWMEFMLPFQRGIIPLSAVILALVLVAAGLCLAVIRLASRRWRPDSALPIFLQVLTLVLALGTAANVARIGERLGVDFDVTADGLSSVSSEALAVLSQAETPVDLVVVVTADRTLPAPLQLRAKELLDMAQALSRARPDLIRLRILRPEDRLDEAGSEAVEIHGLQPRVMMDRTVVGTEQVDAFLGAAVRSAGEQAVIPYFFPGLSVEYELVRAIRTVSSQAAPRDIPTVELQVAISADLPPDLAMYREQVIDKLAEIAGRTHSGIDASILELHERGGEADGNWLAAKALGLQSRQVRPGALTEDEGVTESDAASENETGESAEREVMLAAIATSGEVIRRIQWLADHEDAGTALDDLIIDVRTRASRVKPVVGILATELRINGGFSPHQGRLQPWEIVGEWANQYEIRDVRPEQLADEDFAGVDVLVVALPSALSEERLQHLYDYIYAGNPTLLLLDPMPFDAMQQGRFFGPLEPPEPPPQQFSQMQPDPKGQVARFMRGLGLQWDPGEVLWSRYNPSSTLRFIGPHFVWLSAERGSIIGDHPITSGIDSLMAIYPGVFTAAAEHAQGLHITPLLRPTPDLEWGVHHYHDLVRRDPHPRLAELGREIQLRPSFDRVNPMLAAEVRGLPKHIYMGADSPSEASRQPIHVVAVADTDLASSVFFRFYRDVDGEVSGSDLAILTDLRNVQFLSNAIDVLMGDQVMTSLRGRRPSHRTLTRMERIFEDTQSAVDEAQRLAEARREEESARAQARFDEELAAIDRRSDLDARERQQLRATVQIAAQRRLDIRQADIEREKEAIVDRARRAQRSTLIQARDRVKLIGIGVPAALLSLLVLLVLGLRFGRELKDIPRSRSRSSEKS